MHPGTYQITAGNKNTCRVARKWSITRQAYVHCAHTLYTRTGTRLLELAISARACAAAGARGRRGAALRASLPDVSSCRVARSALLSRWKIGAARLLLTQPGGHASGRPPMRWRWRWNTLCPALSPLLLTRRKSSSPSCFGVRVRVRVRAHPNPNPNPSPSPNPNPNSPAWRWRRPRPSGDRAWQRAQRSPHLVRVRVRVRVWVRVRGWVWVRVRVRVRVRVAAPRPLVRARVRVRVR